jgi:hypothetical protein
MLKNIISLIVASLLVLLLAQYLTIGLHWLQTINSDFYNYSKDIFTGKAIGAILRQLIGLLLIPIVLAGIPALLYYAVYRKSMPHFNAVIWILWIILATTMLLK